MTVRMLSRFPLSGIILVAGLTVASSAFAADPAADDANAKAAKSLALRNSCLRCHGVTKKKEGPTYTEVAAKYKGKPDAEERLYQHVTSGELAKLSDGHEENHKIIRSQNEAATRNLVRWILAQ